MVMHAQMGSYRTGRWAIGVLAAVLSSCGGPVVVTENGGETSPGPDVFRGAARTTAEILTYQPAEAHIAIALPPIAPSESVFWQNAEAAAAKDTPALPAEPATPQVVPADALAALRSYIEGTIAAKAFQLDVAPPAPSAAEFARTLGLNPNLPSAFFARYVPGPAGGAGNWHFAAMAPLVDPISAMALTQRLVVEHMGKPVPEIIRVDGFKESVALFTTPEARLMVALEADYIYLANDPALLSAVAARRKDPEPSVYGSADWPETGEGDAVLLANLDRIGPGLSEAALPAALAPWVPAMLRQWSPADAARTYDFVGVSASLAPEGLRIATRGRVRPDSPFVAAAPSEMNLVSCRDDEAAGFVNLQFSPQSKESLLQKMRQTNPASPETPENAQLAGLTGTFLSAIEDEVFLTALPHPSGVPQIRLVAEVSDPAQVRNMALLFGMPSEPYETYNEHEFFRFTFGFVQAHYTFDGNRLVATSNEADLKTFLDKLLADSGEPSSIAEDERFADMVLHLDGPKLYGSLEFPLMFVTGFRGLASVRDYLPAIHAVNAYHGAWHHGAIRVDGSLPLLAGAYLHAQTPR